MRYKTLAITICLAGFLQPGAALTNVALAADKDPFAAARKAMVRDQLSGPGRAITNARVLAVMRKVPRHEFVPERNRSLAYEDGPLPIGYGQTISQPYVVAFMTERLDPKPARVTRPRSSPSWWPRCTPSRLSNHSPGAPRRT